ncbi:ROK family transcriptional regulator [Catenulispora yoronensis]|uniref:ROK family transcriptional regulator n=1 Tax=Catenulispora yoronensis TaxID=450799 RepID=A0ABN2UAW4_9ACTN
MVRAAQTTEDLRRSNLSAVLRQVHFSGPISRTDLTARLGLNRSTIGALTSELVDAGLVTEQAQAGGGRTGRPSLLVRPESRRVHTLAVAIGVDRITAARVGLGGVVLDRRDTGTSREEYSLESVVGTVRAFARSLRAAAPSEAVHVGTGVAFCGIVHGEHGEVCFGPNIGWASEPLGKALADSLAEVYGRHRPVSVGNDADLGALAEHARGAATGCDDVIYLHGDVGIGAGIIVGGTLLAGTDGFGGEVGHMAVRMEGGKQCGCGARGCWETEIGEYALLKAAGREGVGREAVESVVLAARLGDTDAQQALLRVGDWLGFGVANLVNIFNPQMIIMGGMLRGVYLGAATHVRGRLRTATLATHRESVRLRTPVLEDDAPLIGAAELAFARLLADPLEAAR